MTDLVISAKNLGGFARANPCLRCLWLAHHVRPLPYQSFPAIFSSIDRYNKRIVHAYMDRERRLPAWLAELGDATEYIDPPHYTRFSVRDPSTGVTLRGEADGIFRMADGSCTIVDYKTSRYNHARDGLFPVYRVQLNGYAFIADRLGLGPVAQLALVYMEPVTDEKTASAPSVVDDQGFTMGLRATVVPVEVAPDSMIPGLLQKAKSVLSTPDPPKGRPRCKDCAAVARLLSVRG
ncbi:MAG: PD-(D/E)XK nuclease family protein [Dehalococcoidia bacterium]